MGAKAPRISLLAGSTTRSGIDEVRGGAGFRLLLQSRRDEFEHREAVYHYDNQQVTFLNESREFGERIDWRRPTPDAPLLWRFHLHYHEFLLDLLRPENDDPRAAFWRIVEDWIHNNQPESAAANEAAWHPYCISRRLPIWMMVWAEFPPPVAQQSVILESLHEQAAFLATHLEWDLRGNHLLQNLTTLSLASVFFRGPMADCWRKKALRLLQTQLQEQVLEHGEHVERAPMYHAQMLQALLDVRDASAGVDEELERLCRRVGERMASWLAAVLPPDGRIPLLSDGGFGECPTPAVLLRRAGVESEHAISLKPMDEKASRDPATLNGDAWIWRDGNNFLLFDTGPVGPDWLPAHAHSDLLTIEASAAGRRLFVDSGTYDYQDGEMRQYCRSTRAHNVLQVDGAEQCDAWSRFRMGYRGWPQAAEMGEQDGISWRRATHNAYRRLGVTEVGRWIGCQRNGPWVCVDWAKGRGEHQLTHWLHLHPDVDVRARGPASVELTIGALVCELRFLTAGELTLEQGWYCPEFGRRIPSTLLNWTTRATLPGIVAWSLSWTDADSNVADKSVADKSVAVGLSGDQDASLVWGRNVFHFMSASRTN